MMDPGIIEDTRYNPQFRSGINNSSRQQENVLDFLPQDDIFIMEHDDYFEPAHSSGENEERSGVDENQKPSSISPASQHFDENKETVYLCGRRCTFCHFQHQVCANFWAAFNLAQIVLAFGWLSVQPKLEAHTLGRAFSVQPNKDLPKECYYVGQISGSPGSEARLTAGVSCLCIYTFGSILFAVAVFHKNLNLKFRSLFIFIFLVTCASLPLAFLIPLIIDVALCPQSANRFAVLFSLTLTVLVVVLYFDFRIAIMYNKWIKSGVMAKPKVQMSVSNIAVYGSGDTEKGITVTSAIQSFGERRSNSHTRKH